MFGGLGGAEKQQLAKREEEVWGIETLVGVAAGSLKFRLRDEVF
jgi:hypothetical protein